MREIMAEEDTRIGVMVGWNIVLPILTIMGFYFGTVAVSKHVVDLQVRDLVAALPFAGLGAAIGTAIGIFLTFVYPPMVRRDLRREHAAHYEAHRAEGDHQPTSHVDG